MHLAGSSRRELAFAHERHDREHARLNVPRSCAQCVSIEWLQIRVPVAMYHKSPGSPSAGLCLCTQAPGLFLASLDCTR